MRRQVLFVGLICVAFLVNAQEEKTIDLDEVTIQASSIIRKRDRQLIFPSKDQVRRSMDGLDLTRRMSLPRLWVDPNTKSISMANGNVQLRINGVLASSLEVAALSPEDIKRVEYHDNPGLRYGEGVDIVLDYITIKRTSGGNLGVDLSHQLNTFWMADYIYGKYNRGRSEFSLSSFANGHRYKEAWQDRTEIFHTPDGTFQRTQEGIPGRDYEMYWTTTANYNYTKDDDYFLNAKLNFYYYDYPHNYSNALLRNSESKMTTDLIDNNKSLNTRPSLDLYYFRKLPRKQSLAVNVVGTYSNTDSRHTYREELESIPLTDIYTKVDGKRYSVIGEGIYEKELETGRISAGLKHTQAYTDNVYSGSGDYTTHMTESESYMYAQYVGTWKKLVYNVGLGASRNYLSQENSGSYNRWYFRPQVTLTYTINEVLSARYRYTLRNVNPSLSELSNVEQWIDSLQVRRGNPGLSPFLYHNNAVEFHVNTAKVKAGFTFSYQYQPRMVMEETLYDASRGLFIRTYDNQRSFHRFTPELYLNYSPFGDYLRMNICIREKMDLDVQVAKLKVLRGDFQNQKYRLEDKLLKTFPEEIQKQKTRIAALQQDSQIAAAHPQDKENFCGMTIKGMVYDDKKAAGERLLLARQEMPNADMMLLGTYRGFELNIRFDSFKNEHQAVLRAELSYPVSLGDDARGNITRLDNAIDNFADRIADAENALQNLEQQKQAAEVEVAKPFAQEEELAEKSARLAELNALLNIDRDRSSSQDAPEETEATETPATRPSVLAALGEKTNQPEPVKPFRSYYDKDGDAR